MRFLGRKRERELQLIRKRRTTGIERTASQPREKTRVDARESKVNAVSPPLTAQTPG